MFCWISIFLFCYVLCDVTLIHCSSPVVDPKLFQNGTFISHNNGAVDFPVRFLV